MKSVALDELVINSALKSDYWRVSVIDECNSTQDLLLKGKATAGTVITTEYQSAGRGRLDRRFDSPKGSGLLFSLSYQPRNQHGELIERDLWGAVNLIAGYVVANVLNEYTGEKFITKWPNDIIIEKKMKPEVEEIAQATKVNKINENKIQDEIREEIKKVSGMLAQVFDDHIYLGIGINVTTTPDELPVPTATSLYIETNKIIDRNEILPSILNQLEVALADFSRGEDFRPHYRAVSSTLGKNVQALLPSGEKIYGRAIDINPNGSLLLENGLVIEVGDIVHLSNSQ